MAGVVRRRAKTLTMTMHEASRTLVKSTPELWAECSDGESLRRHLGAFGEIRITKLEPETAVAWEGDDVRGTVTLEPSGWGTRVVLTATAEGALAAMADGADAAVSEEPDAVAEPDPDARAEPRDEPPLELEPEAGPEPASERQDQPPAVPEPTLELEAAADPEPEVRADSEPTRSGFFARLFGRRRRAEPESSPLGDGDPLIGLAGGGDLAAEPPLASEAEVTPQRPPEVQSQLEPAVEPAPDVSANPDPDPAQASSPTPTPTSELDVLVGALDSLGTAHRRPFSRS